MRSLKWTGTAKEVRPARFHRRRLHFAFGFTFFLLALALSQSALARTWFEITSHLGVLGKQIETEENEIRALIAKKKHTYDQKEIAEIVKEMGAQQKLLEKALKTYNEEIEQSRFEFPEKNDQLDRNYVRRDEKSLDELEHEHDKSLDGQLDQLRNKVLATFPLPIKPQASNQTSRLTRKPASQDDDDAPEKIHLTK